MSNKKISCFYFVSFFLVSIILTVSLCILNIDTILKWGMNLRVSINTEALTYNKIASAFSKSGENGFIKGKTIEGERIDALYFYQILSDKNEVVKFIEEYHFKIITDDLQRKTHWDEMNKYFKESKLKLPSYNKNDLLVCNPVGTLMRGPVLIYITPLSETSMLVTFFHIHI